LPLVVRLIRKDRHLGTKPERKKKTTVAANGERCKKDESLMFPDKQKRPLVDPFWARHPEVKNELAQMNH